MGVNINFVQWQFSNTVEVEMAIHFPELQLLDP